MFDIGFWEILVIGVVALLVVGPERLPGVARSVGRWVGQVQRFVRNARADIQRELEAENLKSMLDEQEKQIHELRSMVQDRSGGDALGGLRKQLDESAEEINRSFNDAGDSRSSAPADAGRDRDAPALTDAAAKDDGAEDVSAGR